MNETWQPSGIDFGKVLAEFRDFRPDMTEAEFVSRVEACRGCSLCRQSKCLATGSCVGRKCRAPVEFCPKGRWGPVD